MFTWAVVHVITYIYFLRAPQKASSSVTRPQSLIIFLKQPLLPVSPKLEPTHAPVAQTNSPQYNYCNIIQSVSVISRKWYYRNNFFFFFSVDFISCAKNIEMTSPVKSLSPSSKRHNAQLYYKIVIVAFCTHIDPFHCKWHLYLFWEPLSSALAIFMRISYSLPLARFSWLEFLIYSVRTRDYRPVLRYLRITIQGIPHCCWYSWPPTTHVRTLV